MDEVRQLLATHDVVVGDGPAGLDEVSRALLLMADLTLLPISPSILDLRSVNQATTVLHFAQGINGGRPQGLLVLNKMRERDTISRELLHAAPKLGVDVASSAIRDLQAYRDAAQQGTVVCRMGRLAKEAAGDLKHLFSEILGLKACVPLTQRPAQRLAKVAHG